MYASNAAGGTPLITRMPFAGHDFVPYVSGAINDASCHCARTRMRAGRPRTIRRLPWPVPLLRASSGTVILAGLGVIRSVLSAARLVARCGRRLAGIGFRLGVLFGLATGRRSSRVDPPSLHDVEIGLAGQQISSSSRPHNLSASTVPALRRETS
jgi:hypothetical protein